MSNTRFDADFNLAEYLLHNNLDDDSVMFHYGDRDIVRSELVSIIETFRGHLGEIGVTESDRVLLLLYDTPAFIASFLACMYLGAIPVPLNPRSSIESVSHVMNDSRARFAIVEADAVATLVPALSESPFMQTNGIIVQDYYHHELPTTNHNDSNGHSIAAWLEHATKYKHGKACLKKPHSIAFWQYSSGTTGLPKAVQHTQRGMLENTGLFARETLKITEKDKIYSIPKMFFGYGLGNSFFFPLLASAQALIDSQWPSPERVISNLRSYKPTVFFGVPAMYNALLDDKWGLMKEEVSGVRLWFSAGTPLPEQIYNRWKERFGADILDGIGATEVGHVFLTNTPEQSAPGSTGYPVPGYDVRLLTENGQEAATGEQGVLLVKGPSLSPGYWENPSLNQIKFKDGWYRTGDVFVRGENGDYRCQGREDDLFKVKGRWVVPLEVESTVHRHFPQVKEAVLVGRTDNNGMTVPVLFICSEATDPDNLINDIDDFLKEQIESYKQPSDCYVVKELPRNDNGKLLRSKLVEMSQVGV